MSQFIDRRPNSKHKSAVNRQRFIKRFKQQIKKAVSHTISGRSIKNIDTGEKISIPAKDLNEPHFSHGKGGRREYVHPGNVDFDKGDKVPRPGGQGQGQGSQASKEGEGEDAFSFELSRDEFLDLFFEDLELPNLVKKKLNQLESFKWVRAGHTPSGNPSSISVVRSLTHALGRRMALGAPYKKELKVQEEKLAKEEKATHPNDDKINKIKKEMKRLKGKLENIPFIDTFDIRYHNKIKQPAPNTQAVVFCLMDVSGSMDEAKKDIAKRFFTLLYLFLTRAYKKIDVVFIRHHTAAKEVDEHAFFYSRETGGTVVSSALEMMVKIMNERYDPENWNIYAAQASDGDNWMNDSPHCRDILMEEIMPKVQYYAYVEIMPRQHQSLWEVYQEVAGGYPQFSMQHIQNQTDIYPVFRDLFKKEVSA